MLSKALFRACSVAAGSAVLVFVSCSSSDGKIVERREVTAGEGGESPGSANAAGAAGSAGATSAGGDATHLEPGADAGGAPGSAGAPTDPDPTDEGGAGAGGQGADCVLPGAVGGAGGAGHASQVLYTNDFETPNMALVASCGNSLDPIGINALYGSSSFLFQQVNTVEGVSVHDPSGLYSDPSGVGQTYSLGMLSALQDDLLALTFEVTGNSFLNVGFDLSAIDVSGCGGPFGTDVPVMQVRLYDTPSGGFSFGAPGTLLGQGEVTGVAAPDQWTFAWKYGVVSLDATGATGSSLTIVFDLTQSGYAAFDNLSIVAADTAGVVDADNNGIPDDQECPMR